MSASNKHLAELKAKPKDNLQKDIKTAGQGREERGFVYRSTRKNLTRSPAHLPFSLILKSFPKLGKPWSYRQKRWVLPKASLSRCCCKLIA
ncbi:MAG: hypothetical protein OXH90_07100 [Paracoccaceae bacterium]|nr:hypothetical protein [Paracoccaceae bacterium]MDE2915866.1 hypothetical protein [Paracoccaceae bacterium]